VGNVGRGHARRSRRDGRVRQGEERLRFVRFLRKGTGPFAEEAERGGAGGYTASA
jgi:hypothetical protein